MTSKRGLDAGQIIESAARVADRDGLASLTLARVAAELGVRSPSLFNHIAGLDGLRHGLAELGLNDLAHDMRKAAVGLSGPDAIRAIASAYRQFAKRRPGLFAAMPPSVEGAAPTLHAAGNEILEIMLAGLRAWALPKREALHAVRCLRSAVHGFVVLEAGGGFGMPLDVDTSFARLVDMLVAGLGTTAPKRR